MADRPRNTTRPTKRKKKRLTPGRVIGRILLVLLGLVVVGGLAGAAVLVVAYQRVQVPDPNTEFTTNTSYIYYGDAKTKLGSIEVQNRQSITYAQMPDSIKNAVVAAENNTFWTDPGYSVPGMVRAAVNIARGGSLQGGSTITQQYIKVMYLTEQQTVSRKIKEVLLARKLTQRMTKQEILTDYLNTIYFGRGAYGVQAASHAYFNTSAENLTVPQSAVLAAVLNDPAYLDPTENGGNDAPLLDRYRYVLQSMAKSGYITSSDAATYSQALPKLPKVPVSEKYRGPQGFLLKSVESELSSLPLDESEVRGGGYKIITTFNKKDEDAAIKSAQKYTKMSARDSGHKSSKNLHAAIASVDTNTGNVLALYGGADYIQNSRNWAATPRATASTFKPFALATGLESGFSVYSIMNGDTFTPPGDGVPIRNEFSEQYGPVTLLKATADSINTAFVDLDTKIPGNGPEKVINTAQKIGALKEKGAQDWVPNDRVAIGSAQVSPLNMANAYATFANNGVYNQRHVIKEILDNKGHVVYKAKPATHRAIPKDVDSDVSLALQGVVKDGTGVAAQELNRPVAGKTGTQGVGNKITSAWFTGYTKQIATSVMYVAGDGGNKDLDPYKRPYDPTFFGSGYPLLTWMDYMQTATKGQKVLDFPDPAYVNRDKYPPQQTNTPKPPPSSAPATSAPPKSAPPTSAPPTSAPPTSAPPTSAPPSKTPPPPPPTTKTPPAPPPTTSNPHKGQKTPPAKKGGGVRTGTSGAVDNPGANG